LPDGKTIADRDPTWSEDYGTCYVDRYAPNAWGFYSMIGNVDEWSNMTSGWESALDPDGVLPDDYKGPIPTGTAANNRYLLGGSWATVQYKYEVNVEYGTAYYSADLRSLWADNGRDVELAVGTQGFRICLTIPNAAQ